MLHKSTKIKQSFTENINFYDEVASTYNSTLEQTDSNKIIRQKVAEKFCRIVNKGWIMDFGGGTGLDIKWLTNNGYKVFFCEPSAGMREQAIIYNEDVLHNSKIIVLGNDDTDFKKWNNTVPFTKPVNGILSNFAVINNIDKLELLFKKLALVLNSGGHLIALVLNNNFQKNSLRKLADRFASFVFQKPAVFYVQHKTHKQIVFLHSLRQLKNASKTYFNFFEVDKSLSEFGFNLIHLIKK